MKTWKNNVAGEFTVCERCGERIILKDKDGKDMGIFNATTIIDDGKERVLFATIDKVNDPKRVSTIEMQRRLDNYLNKANKEK